ncbi:MAG: ATP-dependent helicase [Mameliella sp.]|nr:ATP-dependent helicase [Phaeodactylibacter sp.]
MQSDHLIQKNPAEISAKKALSAMFECLQNNQSFLLEAGAGAGKTYSLVEALKKTIKDRGLQLQRSGNQVACITYTNMAVDEILSRIDNHPVIYVSTIHAFCWDLIKSFQPTLNSHIPNISGWAKLLEEINDLGSRRVEYELGYRKITEGHAFLHHDDVLKLFSHLMNCYPKFRRILSARFPILFIDEYQDTDKELAYSLVNNFIRSNSGPLIGLFGDSWQKIYRDGVGRLEEKELKYIGKEANFRSSAKIVDVLNKMRVELQQKVKDESLSGSVKVFHSNDWLGDRRTGGHWSGDLPEKAAQLHLVEIQKLLKASGWSFSPEKTKILMLTHKVLASQQNYTNLLDVFRYNDSLINKESPYIAFLVDVVEPFCRAYTDKKYGEMFLYGNFHSGKIRNLRDKKELSYKIKKLIEQRNSGSIGDVLDVLKETKLPPIPDTIEGIEKELLTTAEEDIQKSRTLSEAQKIRNISYQELIALSDFVNNYTPFSTKHGVKGAEFDDVLVVLGRGWNQYNWNEFLEWSAVGFPKEKEESYARNRNLFYVACSRPKKRLALLITQKLSDTALGVLKNWFGEENVCPLPLGMQ